MRGIKESGRIFAIPTYVYMLDPRRRSIVVRPRRRSFFGDIAPVPFDPEAVRRHPRESAARSGIFLLLKGFSSGAVALTGVEAISNGVPAFRRPESKNAAATLVWMGVLLGTLFLGISVLAHHLQPYPSHDRTVIAQLGLAGVRQRPRVRDPAVRDRGDPRPRRQHRVQRVPEPVVDHRQGRLPPAPAREPRRPARVLERHHRAGGGGRRAARRVRRHHQRADPALRGRGVHVVHAVAVGHGAPPPQAAEAGLAAQRRAQRRRARPRRSSCC